MIQNFTKTVEIDNGYEWVRYTHPTGIYYEFLLNLDWPPEVIKECRDRREETVLRNLHTHYPELLYESTP